MKSTFKIFSSITLAIFFLFSFTACKSSEIVELKEKVAQLESQLEGEVEENKVEKGEENNRVKESEEIEYYKDKIEIINVEMTKIIDDLFDWITKRSKDEISEEDLFDIVYSVPIWIDEAYTKFLRVQIPDEIKNINSIYEKAFEYYLVGAIQLNLSIKDMHNKVDTDLLEKGLFYFKDGDRLKEKLILALENPERREEIFIELKDELNVVVDASDTESPEELVEEPAEVVDENIQEEVSSDSNNEEEILNQIMEKAKIDWPNDKEMQEFQYDNQVEAYYEILDLPNTSDFRQEILTKAKNDWLNDYEMQLFQYDNQLEAYHQIQNLPNISNYRTDIIEKAQNDWANDYEMQLFQYDNQLEAYLEIKNLPSTGDYNEAALNMAKSDWPGDYEMQLWQYNNEK